MSVLSRGSVHHEEVMTPPELQLYVRHRLVRPTQLVRTKKRHASTHLAGAPASNIGLCWSHCLLVNFVWCSTFLMIEQNTQGILVFAPSTKTIAERADQKVFFP